MGIVDPFGWAIEKIFEVEGGFSNDPADPGGATRWGISSRAYPDVDVANLTKDQAKGIYRRDYWDPVGGDRLAAASAAMALLALDGAVQHGVETSVRLLQRALRVPEDGSVGQQTLLAAMKAKSPDAARLLSLRAEFYVNLIGRKPPMVKFRNGWFQRLFKMALWAAEALR